MARREDSGGEHLSKQPDEKPMLVLEKLAESLENESIALSPMTERSKTSAAPRKKVGLSVPNQNRNVVTTTPKKAEALLFKAIEQIDRRLITLLENPMDVQNIWPEILVLKYLKKSIRGQLQTLPQEVVLRDMLLEFAAFSEQTVQYLQQGREIRFQSLLAQLRTMLLELQSKEEAAALKSKIKMLAEKVGSENSEKELFFIAEEIFLLSKQAPVTVFDHVLQALLNFKESAHA